MTKNHPIFKAEIESALQVPIQKVFGKILEDRTEESLVSDIISHALILGEKRNKLAVTQLTHTAFNKRCMGIARIVYSMMGKFDNGQL